MIFNFFFVQMIWNFQKEINVIMYIIESYILKQQCLSVCVGSAWKILPIIARSLWN